MEFINIYLIQILVVLPTYSMYYIQQVKMKHVSYIDGLKGICCLIVFLCHFRMMGFAPTSSIYENSFIKIFFWGDLAVCVFILISAYTISLSYYANKENKTIPVMILKRYFRLAIPIGIVIIVIGALQHLGFLYNKAAAELNGNEHLNSIMPYSSFAIILKNAFLIPLGKHTNIMPQAWMIKYIFYGTFMTIAFIWSTEKMKLPKVIVLCLFFMVLFCFIDIYYTNIIAGFLLFKCHQKISKIHDNYLRYISTFCICLLIVLRLFVPDNFWGPKGYASSLYAIIIVSLVLCSKWLKSFFETRLCLWLGRISFSLYLWHIFVISSYSCWLYITTTNMSNKLRYTLLFISSLTLLLFVSRISQVIIENKIANKILKRIIDFFES